MATCSEFLTVFTRTYAPIQPFRLLHLVLGVPNAPAACRQAGAAECTTAARPRQQNLAACAFLFSRDIRAPNTVLSLGYTTGGGGEEDADPLRATLTRASCDHCLKGVAGGRSRSPASCSDEAPRGAGGHRGLHAADQPIQQRAVRASGWMQGPRAVGRSTSTCGGEM